MKKRTPAEIAHQIFELLNKRDLDTLTELYHDDLLEDFVAIGPCHGPQETRRFFEELFEAFPDFHLEPVHVVATGDDAVVQWRASGTLSGASFQGLAPNGKALELRGVDVMRFREGKLAQNTVYYDGAAFARGVGLLPPVGSWMERALFAGFNAFTTLRRVVGSPTQ